MSICLKDKIFENDLNILSANKSQYHNSTPLKGTPTRYQENLLTQNSNTFSRLPQSTAANTPPKAENELKIEESNKKEKRTLPIVKKIKKSPKIKNKAPKTPKKKGEKSENKKNSDIAKKKRKEHKNDGQKIRTDRKAYMKAYFQRYLLRPDKVALRRAYEKKYREDPKVRTAISQQQKEYRNRPEVKARYKELQEAKKKQKSEAHQKLQDSNLNDDDPNILNSCKPKAKRGRPKKIILDIINVEQIKESQKNDINNQEKIDYRAVKTEQKKDNERSMDIEESMKFNIQNCEEERTYDSNFNLNLNMNSNSCKLIITPKKAERVNEIQKIEVTPKIKILNNNKQKNSFQKQNDMEKENRTCETQINQIRRTEKLFDIIEGFGVPSCNDIIKTPNKNDSIKFDIDSLASPNITNFIQSEVCMPCRKTKQNEAPLYYEFRRKDIMGDESRNSKLGNISQGKKKFEKWVMEAKEEEVTIDSQLDELVAVKENRCFLVDY